MNKNDPTLQFIVRNRRTICGFLIILVLFEILIVYIMYNNYHENYLGREEAVSAALGTAGFDASQVSGLESDFETENGTAWFEITFIHDGTKYSYRVDAETGEVTILQK